MAPKHPTIIIPAETMELYRAQSRRAFIGEPITNINALDPDCPFGVEDDRPETEDGL